jgi:hypothetical protein
MHKPIFENITIYKIPTNPLNEKSLEKFGSFIVKSARHPAVYLVSKENNDYAKFLDSIAEEKISIDKLFYPDERNAKKVCIALPKDATCEMPLVTNEKIKKQVERGFKNVVNSDAKPEELERYAKDILKLSRKERSVKLEKDDIVFLSQLNDDGWVIPRRIISVGESRYFMPSLKFHENYGLIKTKTLKGTDVLVKLTNKGRKVKENAIEQSKKILESRELHEGVFPSVLRIYPPDELEFRKEYARITRGI